MQRLFTLLVTLLIAKVNGDPGDFRPPAVPLIVFSPHISGKVLSCVLIQTKIRSSEKKECQSTPILSLS